MILEEYTNNCGMRKELKYLNKSLSYIRLGRARLHTTYYINLKIKIKRRNERLNKKVVEHSMVGRGDCGSLRHSRVEVLTWICSCLGGGLHFYLHAPQIGCNPRRRLLICYYFTGELLNGSANCQLDRSSVRW